MLDAHVTHKDISGLSFLERYLATSLYPASVENEVGRNASDSVSAQIDMLR